MGEWCHAGRGALGEERLAEALRVAHPGCSSSFTMGPRCVQGNYKLQTGEQTKYVGVDYNGLGTQPKYHACLV